MCLQLKYKLALIYLCNWIILAAQLIFHVYKGLSLDSRLHCFNWFEHSLIPLGNLVLAIVSLRTLIVIDEKDYHMCDFEWCALTSDPLTVFLRSCAQRL